MSPIDADQARAWIAAAQGGDRHAFRQLVESYSRRLMSLAFRYTRDWDVSQDLTQDTWIKVFRNLSRFRPGSPFEPWLYTIHRNVCLSHLRQRKRKAEVLSDEIEPAADAGDDRHKAADRGILAREFWSQIGQAMKSLSPRQQEVFALIDIEGQDQRSVAALLSIEPATLRSTLHFARRRLAQLMLEMEAQP